MNLSSLWKYKNTPVPTGISGGKAEHQNLLYQQYDYANRLDTSALTVSNTDGTLIGHIQLATADRPNRNHTVYSSEVLDTAISHSYSLGRINVDRDRDMLSSAIVASTIASYVEPARINPAPMDIRITGPCTIYIDGQEITASDIRVVQHERQR